ncbi:MAG: hypothetical protein EP315_09185 [Gammaproteobacteria bacterium]|nr:MAG: hypothetical protein EP315_09185 [Gammaproteobacteria bacterium]
MHKNKYVLILAMTVIALVVVYYLPDNRTERNYAAMLEQQKLDLAVLEPYLQLHEPLDDVAYNRALNQAALLDDQYLHKVINRYAAGSFILFRDTAEHILSKMPSESVAFNLAAGRIYETDEFGLQDTMKAVNYLTFAALRGNGTAAKHLANIYLKANCPVEVAIWAKVVDASDDVSPCGHIPVDVNQFSDIEWNSVLENSDRILQARTTGDVPEVDYQSNCSLHHKS